MKKLNKKLVLNKQTMAKLNGEQMQKVAGGYTATCFCRPTLATCATCWVCRPTIFCYPSRIVC